MGWLDAAIAAASGDFVGAAGQAGLALTGQAEDPNSGSDVDYGGGAGTGAAFSANVGGPSGVSLTVGGGGGQDIDTGGGGGGGGASADLGAIVYKASVATGRSLSKKAIVAFIMKWGWKIAQCAFQLQSSELMAVFVAVKAKPTKKRGPHLYTVLKRIRAGERYTKMLAKVAAKAGVRRKASSPRASARVITFPARRKAR